MREAENSPDENARARDRPAEPKTDATVTYRGWELGWNPCAAFWGAEPWEAHRGGVDLGAPRVTAKAWTGLLDEVDAYEDEEVAL